MHVLSPPSSYADSLLFAAEVTDAATLVPHGEHGADRVRRPFLKELQSHEQANWDWCDNKLDFELAASAPLRATAEYLAARHALSMPARGTRPAGRAHLLPLRQRPLRAVRWSGLPERMRRRQDELEGQPPLDRVRAFVGGELSDADSLDEVRAGWWQLAGMNTRALKLDLRALDAVLAAPQPPGLLSELVAWDANWVLDDTSDAGAEAFLRQIAEMLRQVVAEAEPGH
jgi:hypothetical protein